MASNWHLTPILRQCFVCSRDLFSALTGERSQAFQDPPGRAVIFSASGNYGSQVFDPVGRSEYLEISVCDSCLTAARERVLLVRPERGELEPWR